MAPLFWAGSSDLPLARPSLFEGLRTLLGSLVGQSKIPSPRKVLRNGEVETFLLNIPSNITQASQTLTSSEVRCDTT